MKYLIISFLVLALNIASNAQYLSHQPIVGAVTSSSAKIYVKTDTNSSSFTIEVADDATFSNILLSQQDSTRSENFGAVQVSLAGLEADQRYYYRFIFDGNIDLKGGSFETFPLGVSDNPIKIVVGSCNYFSNEQLFQHIQNFKPDLFLHLGDWNWPPAQLGNDYNLYPDKQAASFASRYADPMMATYVMPYTPVDYVYDDDYSYNDSEGWTYPTFTVTNNNGVAETQLFTNPMPAGIREGAIASYFQHFPAYPAVDTSTGIHHQFEIGNVEIFMTDTRNSRMPRHDMFFYDEIEEKWTFEPDSTTHTMLGLAQRNWLLTELQNSTADWKLVGSSVVFNKFYRVILDVAVNLQTIYFDSEVLSGSGLTLASNLAYNWAGYPADQVPFLALKEAGELDDVIFLSGDSHSSALDDGTNAGFPEMMASGLASNDEGTLNYYIDSIGQVIFFPPADEILWNGGGNGLGENKYNYSDSYGTVEVFGSDSLKMCVYDEFNQAMGCLTILHSSLPSSTNSPIEIPRDLIRVIYPNPSRDNIKVGILPAYQIRSEDYIRVVGLDGKIYFYNSLVAFANNDFMLDVTGLPKGSYYIDIFADKKHHLRQFVTH